MPILNASTKDVHTKVFGNYHFIKANAIKQFQEEVEHFLSTERGSLGLVAISEEFMDADYRASEEGQAKLEEAKKEGIMKRVRHLEWLRNNELVSLKQDLEIANMKVDPLILANPAIEDALQELHGYQMQRNDEDKQRVERLRKLDIKIQANQDAQINKMKKDE